MATFDMSSRTAGMKYLVRFAATLLALLLLSGIEVQAMSILDFSRLALDDQATYVSAMVEGSAKMLRDNGHPDQAQKAIDLFKNSTKQGGVNQLAMNLKELQLQNIRNADNPNNRAPVYDVEAAMEHTLRDNGIVVPASYLKTINRNFQPVFPMRAHTMGP